MAQDTDGAAARLAELHHYFREHQATGPVEGHATTAEALAPMRLGVVDHITASVREVAEHTRAANPDAGPLPERVQDAYTWMHENLRHAPEADRLRAEVLEYRHFLEHCLKERDHETVRKQVRPLSCPKCGCWGLMWSRERGLVICTNTECVDRDGFSTTLSLARFAYERVASKQKLRQARAT